MINILIRSHARPIEFQKCIDSIITQTYKNVHLIVSVDDQDTENHTIPTLQKSKLSYQIIQVKNNGKPFNWNLYCNDLKEQVKDGWFFYLDSDDYLADKNSLARIAPHLTDPKEGVICQFLRGDKAKPITRHLIRKEIIRGKIGGSCIFLHALQKDIANWDDKRAADFRFIKAISEKISLKFVKVIVVQAGNNGRKGL